MDIYLFFVVVLFALAISDLIVGVSNDAVNFLNSAIGSKVASRHVIMAVASLGIILGATFSSGMMEVARKGIFHPQHFYFTEIMVVFLGVMLTDILLLDFFNTIGLPTSTTVSVVFELLGAAVAVAAVKIITQPDSLALSEYINSGKALAIISGILLSVVISFTAGVIVQWLSRLLFSFNYDSALKYLGSIWGGLAITAITYFILIKGAKGASFITSGTQDFISNNTLLILGASFVFWTVLMQLLYWIFKTNVLKVVVLTGTFALAMAFAGNDLVNFIGVPLAGFESFKQFRLNGGNDILMTALSAKVQTPTLFLLAAGVIMSLTLWFSKKARTVTNTEITLARQDEGYERWGSSIFARVLVGRAVGSTTFFSKVLPQPVINGIAKRFDQTAYSKKIQKQANPPMFDLIRASVNLTLATVLISFATSLKLPLSTTYVTFMVAMGTSLSDGAWGRDSAVYRITGVFAVIGGWFLTAIIAFIVSFVLAMFISWAKLVAVLILIAFAIYAVIRSNRTHKERQEAIKQTDEEVNSSEGVLSKCMNSVNDTLSQTFTIFAESMKDLVAEDKKDLRIQWGSTGDLNKRVKKQKDSIHKVISKLKQDSAETGHFYVQVIDYQRELTHCLSFIIDPVLKHIENHHKSILESQAQELTALVNKSLDYSSKMIDIVTNAKYDELSNVIEIQTALIEMIKSNRKAQIKRIQNKEVGTRNSMLYMNLLAEIKNMVLYALNMVKAQRDFVIYTKKS